MPECIIASYLHLASPESLVSNKLLPSLTPDQSLLNFPVQCSRNQLSLLLSEHFDLRLAHTLQQPYLDLLFYRRKQMGSLVCRVQCCQSLEFGKWYTNSVIENPISCKELQLEYILKYNSHLEQYYSLSFQKMPLDLGLFVGK